MTFTFIFTFLTFLFIHSWGFPSAAGWTMPTRYILPLFPLMSIPLALLFEKYHKNIIFQTIFFTTIFIGSSFNFIFAKVIKGHLYPIERAEVANNIYLGASKIFPFIDVHDKITMTNLWESTSFVFWIFILVLLSLFLIFAISTLYKKN